MEGLGAYGIDKTQLLGAADFFAAGVHQAPIFFQTARFWDFARGGGLVVLGTAFLPTPPCTGAILGDIIHLFKTL